MDGIDQLNKALQLRPDYDDAMAYMNLLYREKADVECDDPDTRTADLKTADDWVEKTMATKKSEGRKGSFATGHRYGSAERSAIASVLRSHPFLYGRGFYFCANY